MAPRRRAARLLRRRPAGGPALRGRQPRACRHDPRCPSSVRRPAATSRPPLLVLRRPGRRGPRPVAAARAGLGPGPRGAPRPAADGHRRQARSCPADPLVRRATAADLDLLVPACIDMFTAEVGVSPVAGGMGAAYRARIAEIVREGRSFVRIDGEDVVFKAEVGAVTQRRLPGPGGVGRSRPSGPGPLRVGDGCRDDPGARIDRPDGVAVRQRRTTPPPASATAPSASASTAPSPPSCSDPPPLVSLGLAP